jgi:hypothetical protein
MPKPEIRATLESGYFYNPQDHQVVVDYQQAFSNVVTDTLLKYAHTIKKMTDNNKLVGAYYGKFFSIPGYNEWGEFGTTKVLDSPDIDYLIAVEYSERDAGKPHSVTAPMASYTLHNKIFIDEADLRTFLGGTKAWAYAGSPSDTAAMIRKMFILSFVKNNGIHWYDLHGGFFANEGIMTSIKRTLDIAKENLEKPNTLGEAAILVDENAFTYTTSDIKALAREAIAHQQNGKFYRMGANFDMYYINDILRDDFPEYKMYVFLNSWVITPELSVAIEKLKKNNALLVFLYNSGLISNNQLTVENVTKLTNIKMQLLSDEINLAMNSDPKSSCEELKGAPPAIVSSGKSKMVAYPVDKSAKLFGKFLNRDGVFPMAYKKNRNWQSFYSAVPVLPPELWRELARLARCNIYSQDPELIAYIGSNIIGVYSANAGEKIVRFPKKVTFIDAITKVEIAKNTNELKLNMRANETKIINIKE